MKRGWLFWTIAANLVVLIGLVFAYPHLMVSPGPLVPAHAELATDCFACHAPWRGAAAQRCETCHVPKDIGLRSTKGVAVAPKGATFAQRGVKAAFHQDLIEQNCMACHSDHAGPKLTHRSRKPFSHALLRAEVRNSCANCHEAPQNALHRGAGTDCGQCHQPTAWKPATFDHAKLFVLDRDHNTTCSTCHTADNYSSYTCYGCHEHQPTKIRAKHLKEGITDFENCVACHRSADGEPEGRATGGGGKDREGRKRD